MINVLSAWTDLEESVAVEVTYRRKSYRYSYTDLLGTPAESKSLLIGQILWMGRQWIVKRSVSNKLIYGFLTKNCIWYVRL